MEDKNTDFAFAEARAMLALGRLDGALEHCPPNVQRIFAAQILRGTLVGALRQEGHLFTEARFHAWFAGLTTLSEMPSRHASAPRALCEGILIELAHASWAPLADIALQLKPALLAPHDLQSQGDNARTHAAIEDARALVDRHSPKPQPLPFASLSRLYDAVAGSLRFAPADRQFSPIALAGRRFSVERPAPSSPRWAIEMQYGEWLRSAGTLRCALPFTGLIRMDVLAADDPGTARTSRADALHTVASNMFQQLGEATRLALECSERLSGQRTTSRAPALFELLGGFGPLRSAQIESALGATRIGVRGMVAILEDRGMIAHSTIAGSHLHALAASGSTGPDKDIASAFTVKALDDFEASLAHIDELLAGSGN
ncbi:hypothetical protein V474_04875 [Novosphingobium barchaimii LL02]|uniref:Uncharacterized protein n=1 Tax=Novosphingobium barchaimii LL02 TaxID=1114963 RepID=A0A0J7XHC0_9SPHN|nr:hypothetical protein [Novosphingobium barchaimii]KMS51177.1 hypothetical protein V474_04875 [Novosphingobium barchaimii LL02]